MELSKEQEAVVRQLLAQGALIERQRILEDLEAEADNSHLSIALFKLRNIINNNEGLSS
jgi:hypothetical protein